MRMMSRLCVPAIAALAIVCAPALWGQATTGTISGTVTDASGASVPGSTVTVRNLDTNPAERA